MFTLFIGDSTEVDLKLLWEALHPWIGCLHAFHVRLLVVTPLSQCVNNILVLHHPDELRPSRVAIMIIVEMVIYIDK